MTVHVDQHGNVVQASRPAVIQNVTISGVTAQSAAFQTGSPTLTYNPDGTPATQANNTTHIRLISTTNCWVVFGANPTATSTTGMYLPALSPEYFWVVRGEKVAVIQDTAGGTLNISELAQ